MAGGDLYDPLGADRVEAPGPGRRPSAPRVAAAAVILGLAALVAAAWLRDDGDRGQPRAVSTIERVTAPPKPTSTPPPPSSPPSVSAGNSDQDVEIQNGVRIIRPRRGPSAAPGEMPHRLDGVTGR